MEESASEWLEKALGDLCDKMETGLALDSDMISGLVSYCQFAHPLDAKEYLDNIIGQEAGKTVIEEYLLRRGHSNPSTTTTRDATPSSSISSSSQKLHAYVKPPQESSAPAAKKQQPPPAKPSAKKPISSSDNGKTNNSNNNNNNKKKKGGRVVTLAEAAKGSIVFKKGEACLCQARRHGLVGNCLSCGKIVCEQEGEGPCGFCGVLVLAEGSTYAGLDDGGGLRIALSETEAAAEAYAKRLVDYDRNSAARTTVIDDQSDYFEVEGNSWLSAEEKELLIKKRDAIAEEEKEKRGRVVVAFDLVGRKVLMNKDQIEELESESGILRPPDEREVNRIKPNPTLKVQPIFIDPGPTRKNPSKGSKKPLHKNPTKGMNLEITGRVQHESSELKNLTINDPSEIDSKSTIWQGPSSSSGNVDDNGDCSLDHR